MHFISDYISYFFTVLFILFFSAPLKYFIYRLKNFCATVENICSDD